MNIRDKQRGGIVIFAIIGVLLAGLLVGGLYVTKQQARIAEESAPPAIAIDTEKEANETKDVASAPVKGEAKKDTPAAKPPTPATTPGTSASPTQTTVPVSGPSEPLPSTGPSDILLSVFVITAITFLGFVFVQSSSRLRRSALSR